MSSETLAQKDLLIFFDQKKYDSELSYLEGLIPDFQKVFSRFNSLKLGNFTSDNFQSLLLDTENFLYQKTIDSIGDTSPVFAGLKLSKAKLFEMLEKPVGYEALLEEIRIIKLKFQRRLNHFSQTQSLCIQTERDLLHLFTFDDNEIIVLKPSVYEDIKSHFEKFANSQNAKRVFMFSAALKELIDETEIQNVPGKDRFTEFLSSLIKFDAGTGDPIINSDYILSFNRR